MTKCEEDLSDKDNVTRLEERASEKHDRFISSKAIFTYLISVTCVSLLVIK